MWCSLPLLSLSSMRGPRMVAGFLLLLVFVNSLLTGYLLHLVQVYKRRTSDLIAHMHDMDARMDAMEVSHV